MSNQLFREHFSTASRIRRKARISDIGNEVTVWVNGFVKAISGGQITGYWD